MEIYNFGNYFLSTVERCVLRHGKRLELTTKTFDVLQLLVERSREIVTKDQMLDSVWADSFVEEGNLPVHISTLRRALDGTGTERFIETVHGTGYRFVSEVRSASKAEWLEQTAHFRNAGNPTDTQRSDSATIPPPLSAGSEAEINHLVGRLTETFRKNLLRILRHDATERLSKQKQRRPRERDADADTCSSCAARSVRTSEKRVTALSKTKRQIKSRKRTH